MKIKEIKNYKWEEKNPHYDIEKCFNGGGYSQPLITFDYGDNHYEIEDSSCGDFGRRFVITANGKLVGYYDNVGECESYNFTEDENKFTAEEFSQLTEDFNELYDNELVRKYFKRIWVKGE